MKKPLSPMLATLIDAPFDAKGWLFEVKWDGYRAIAYKSNDVELISRNQLSFNERYPDIAASLSKIKGQFILDGEIVIVDEEGRSQFQLLQNYQNRKEGTPLYYAFDILYYEGKDLRELPLIERKKVLKKLLARSPNNIRYSDHIVEKGISFFKEAKQLGLEGIMAKRADSPYQNRRSRDWLKIKTVKRQEVVIGGFTEPRGSRKGFGALLVGVYQKKELLYVGHVGGGFNTFLLKEISLQLKSHEQKECPFINPPHPNAPVHWVKPQLVCEVSFAEWTDDEKMRQPIFKGMREDKPARKVTKEPTKKVKP